MANGTKKTPDISIIVPSWNASDIIEEALASISTTATDIDVDVLVIDDASPDNDFVHIREKFEHDSRFTFVQNAQNVGYSATANQLLERARGKYLMTFDTDARLKPGTLRALFDFMEAHPEAGAATGKLLNPDGTLQGYYRRILTPSLFFFTTPLGRVLDKLFFGLRFYKRYHYDDLDLSRTSEMQQPPVACLIIRREALGSDPYIFDPRFRLYMLDVDFSKRLYDRGYKVFVVASAPVIHLKTASAGKRGNTWLGRELDKSFRDYFKKHYRMLYPLIFLTMWLDRVARALSHMVFGREPMR